MIERQRAISRGELEATPYDESWLQHELMEKRMMDQGIPYDDAHRAALDAQGLDESWDLWPKEMIKEYRGTLSNKRWEDAIQDRLE